MDDEEAGADAGVWMTYSELAAARGINGRARSGWSSASIGRGERAAMTGSPMSWCPTIGQADRPRSGEATRPGVAPRDIAPLCGRVRDGDRRAPRAAGSRAGVMGRGEGATGRAMRAGRRPAIGDRPTEARGRSRSRARALGAAAAGMARRVTVFQRSAMPIEVSDAPLRAYART